MKQARVLIPLLLLVSACGSASNARLKTADAGTDVRGGLDSDEIVERNASPMFPMFGAPMFGARCSVPDVPMFGASDMKEARCSVPVT